MFALRQRRYGRGRNGNKAAIDGRVKAAVEGLELRTLFNALVWSNGPALPAAVGNAATVNSYGSVDLIGGTNASGTSSSSAYSYDPYAGAWSTALSLDQARAGAGVGFTGNPGPLIVNSQGVSQWKYASEIFVYGGQNQGQATASVLNYVDSNNIDGNSVAAPPMSTPRASMAYTTDPATGDLYAIGGINGSTALASAERYDPVADAWSPIAPLPQAVYAAAAVNDGVGHLFVIGGDNSAGHPVNTVYRYTLATDTWDTMGSMPFAASSVGAVDAAYGQIYVAGGKTAGGPTSSVEWYNPVLDQWNHEAPLLSPVYGASVVIDSAGNVDVMGGFNAAGKAVSSFYTSPVGPAPVGLPATPTISFDTTWVYYNGQPVVVTPTAYASDGFTPVDGTYTLTYNGSATPPTIAGTYNLVATFTSFDPNYTSTATTGTLYIAPANPTLTLSGDGTITWNGQPHAVTGTVVGLDGTTPVPGALAVTYNGLSTAPVNPGSYSVVATFTSADPNYADATATTNITIPDPTIPTGVTSVGDTPTSFTISWNPVATPISGYNVYHRTVAHSPKGSGATIYYTLVATTTGTSVSFDVGAQIAPYYYVVSSVSTTGVVSPYSAIIGAEVAYAPTIDGLLVGGGFVNYGTVEAGQSLTASLAAYGNPFPTFQMLSGPSTMSIDPTTGIITYSPTSAEVGYNAATFEATNSQGSVTASYSFHVLAIPTVVVTGGTFTFDGNTHGASAVAYGTDGITPIAGTFSTLYNGGSTAPYAMAGTWPVSVIFTSSDPNYGGASGSGVVVINPATPTLTLTGGGYAFDGSPHPAAASVVGVDGVSPVSGSIAITYNGSANLPTAPGTYDAEATFTGADVDYANISASTTVTIAPPVTQLTPTVLVSNDVITYDGQQHGAYALAVAPDGVTSVAGAYAITYDGSSTLPTDAGVYQVAVHFSSADPNFTNASGTGTLTIAPATPTASLSDNTLIFDGLTHPARAGAVGIDGVTPVDGSFSYTYNGLASLPIHAGTYSIAATFTSNDPNYGSATTSATLTINPANPTFTAQGGTVTYNGKSHSATASAIGVNGTTPVPGSVTYTYNGSSTSPTNAGTYTVVATFTSSTPDYFNASAPTTLVINKATPTVTVTGGTFSYSATSHAATATQVGIDGVTPVAGSMAITYNGSTTVPTNAGTYAVVATFTSSNANYGTGTATTTLIINKLTPVFSNLSSPTILAGTSTTSLGGTLAAGTYYPTGSTVSITVNGTTKTAAVSSTGTFSASFTTSAIATSATPYAITYTFGATTNFNAASGAGVLTVTANPPVIATSPASQTVLSGKAVTFTAAATGTPTPTVQWQVSTDGGKTFTNISGATKTTYSFTAAATQNGYEYRAVFSSVGGSATTSAATLTVQTAPAVTTSPKTQTVIAGHTVTFTAAASGSPAPTVQWQVSTDNGTTWTNLAGATQTTLSFTTASSQNGYRYRAVFTSAAGTATTGSATLTVQSAPVVTLNPLSQTVLPGQKATFTAAATGNPTPTVQWQVSSNGGTTWSNVSGATSTTLTLTVTASQNGYLYRAVFTNSVGTTPTTAATLTT